MFKNINTISLSKDLVRLIHISLLLFLSILVNYYFGSIGVWPIDTFAFFDSANFINKGFLPIRDYWTSNGLLIDFVQAIFFKFFGANWMIYLLQSTILNFLFSYFTYNFLRNEGLGPTNSLFYSLLVSILAYPSSGTPFPDHHAIFLSIIGIFLLINAIKKDKFIIWFFIPIILFLAFLSKQTPSAFFIILILFYSILFSIYKKNYNLFIPLIIFSILIILLFIYFLFLNQIYIQDFVTQYILFPLTIGSERAGSLDLYSFLNKLFTELKFVFVTIVIIIIQIVREFSQKKKYFSIIFNSNFIFLIVSIILILNQNLIKNQNIIFFLLPILIGLIHLKIDKNYKFREKLINLIIICSILLSIKYHYRFNVDRKLLELEGIEKTQLIDSANISSNLRGLKWITVTSANKIKNEAILLKESIDFLKINKKDSLIISDYQFILSEIDHSHYPPNRWHTEDGVSYPLEGNKFHELYLKFYKDKLKRNKIKKIFSLYPLDQNNFDFILGKECIKTTKINKILNKHEIFNCFENVQ